jgi:titin
VTVKAGQIVNLEAVFIGEPEPTFVWSSEKVVEIKQDSRFSMSIDVNKCKLVILDTKRSDTGKYVLKLKNESGTDTASCEVIVLSAPAKPSGPIEIKEVKK